MKIALIQMGAGDNKKDNFAKAVKFIKQSINKKADIICLPEFFLYVGPEKYEMAENLDSDYIKEFKNLAKNNKVNIVLGSISLKVKNSKKVTNSSLIINRQGKIVHRYDKIYMYDVFRPDLVIKESATTVIGDKLGVFKLDGVKMGVGICIDLRFPEYFRALVKNGVEIIFLPSHFRKATGEIAWEALTIARAIENQVYFCACDQTGGIGNKERCGNTRIISYDGKILKNIEKKEGMIIASVDLKSQKDFRNEFPVLKQIKNYK